MMSDYSISTDKSKLDIYFIHQELENYYWSKNLSLYQIERMIDNSFCIGAYDVNNKQVGFIRAISDGETFAYYSDLFISIEHRGRGLFHKLYKSIRKEFGHCKQELIMTKDMQRLYSRYDFMPLKYPERFMEVRPKEPVA